jgi:hypothetical protein
MFAFDSPRRTLTSDDHGADLTADQHYGELKASIAERGMGHYGESHEDGRAFIADGMEVKKRADSFQSRLGWIRFPCYQPM